MSGYQINKGLGKGRIVGLNDLDTDVTTAISNSGEPLYIISISSGTISVYKPSTNQVAFSGTDLGAILNSVIADMTTGSKIYIKPSTYPVNSTININIANVTIEGDSRFSTTLQMNSPTGDVFNISSANCKIINIGFTSSVVRTAGFYINQTGLPSLCEFSGLYMEKGFNCIRASGSLSLVTDCRIVNFVNFGILIDGAGTQQRLDTIEMDNSPALAAGSGIEVQQTGSVFLSNCDIVHSNNDLHLNPSAGNAISALYAVNCFLDTAVNGLKCENTGNINYAKFTNCWFSSHSNAGMQLSNPNSTIEFVNCHMLGNSTGIWVTAGVGFTASSHFIFSKCIVSGSTGSSIALQSIVAIDFIGCRFGAYSTFAANVGAMSISVLAWVHLFFISCDMRGDPAPSGANQAGIIFSLCDGFNGSASSAIGVGASPFSYTNTDGFSEQVVVQGGTVSNVSIKRGATTINTGVIAGVFLLYPSDILITTYTVAPTMTKIPL